MKVFQLFSIVLSAITLMHSSYVSAASCRPDEISKRTIPGERAWKTAEKIRAPLPNAYLSWVKIALGFDWRDMNTKGNSVTIYPAPVGYSAAFFVSRSDPGWCGSGGCSLMLYFCKKDSCDSVWSGFDGSIHYPGTSTQGWADFIVDKSQLVSFERGKLRDVCKVEVK